MIVVRALRRHRSGLSRIAVTIVLLSGWTSTLLAGPFTKADLPTFYQHQLAGGVPGAPPDAVPAAPNYDLTKNWWENGGGWCATTAFIDSLYYWDKHGLSGLFDHSNLGGANAGKSWLERYAYANSDLALFAGAAAGGGCATANQVVGYLDAHAGAANAATEKYGYTNSLTMTDYQLRGGKVMGRVVSAAGEGAWFDTGYTSMFAYYYAVVQQQNKTINIRITGDDPSWWWRGSFHFLAGAGVETVKGGNGLSDMWYSDPDIGKNNKDGWGNAYLNTDPIPMGQPAAAPFLPYQVGTFDDAGMFLSGTYKGALISNFYVLSVVPEPGTLGLASICIVVSIGVGLRRRIRGQAFRNP